MNERQIKERSREGSVKGEIIKEKEWNKEGMKGSGHEGRKEEKNYGRTNKEKKGVRLERREEGRVVEGKERLNEGRIKGRSRKGGGKQEIIVEEKTF